MVEIDKGVPRPEKAVKVRRLRYLKLPTKRMDVGDSYFVPGVSAMGLQNAARHARVELGYKFDAYTVVEGGVWGARIWRIE